MYVDHIYVYICIYVYMFILLLFSSSFYIILYVLLCMQLMYGVLSNTVVHCGSTRQTASIIYMDKEHLRTGDKASCRFRFIKSPEYLKPGTRMVFREGRTKAVGNVAKIHPIVPGVPFTKPKSIKPSHHHRTFGAGETNKSGTGRGRKRGGRKHAALKEKTAVSSISPSPTVTTENQT